MDRAQIMIMRFYKKHVINQQMRLKENIKLKAESSDLKGKENALKETI